MPTQTPTTSSDHADHKPIIGLMGGPGSGKSTVAEAFAALGCAIINADKLAHDALQTKAVKKQIKEQWGDDVFNEQGEVVRAALGRIVFADPAALKQLESILHPLVHQGGDQLRKHHQADAQVVAIVEDCPLLLESGLDRDCDCLVFVDTPDELRLERVRTSRNWDAQELEKRDRQQFPLDTKRQAADYVIRNDRDLAHVREQAGNVLKSITNTAPR